MTAALLLLLAVGLPGLVLALLVTRGRPTLLQLAALVPALGLICAPCAAVLLACAHSFDPPRLLAAQGLLLAWLAALAARHGHLRLDLRALRADLVARRGEYAALALLLALVAMAVERPSEWVLSERMDAANYLVQGAYQVRHASLFFDDGQPEAYAADFSHALWTLNSTSGRRVAGGPRQFPFPPFFRFQLALALLCGGTRAALHLPLLLGLVAVLAARLALGALVATRFHALLGTALLAGSPLLIQFMRVPMAELALLFMLLTGLALLALACASGSRAAAAGAGLVLGLAPLVRIDGLLVYAGVLLALVARLPRAAHVRRTFAPAFLAVSAAAWGLSVQATSLYLDAHLQGRLALANALVFGSAALGLCACAGPFAGRANAALRACGALALPVVTAGVALQAVARLVARPLGELPRVLDYLGAKLDGSVAAGAPPSLLGPAYLGVPTLLAGIAGLLLAARQRRAAALAWAAPCVFGSMLYLEDLRHMPGFYWASRRYLPFLLPLLVAGAAVAFEWLETRARRRWGGLRGQLPVRGLLLATVLPALLAQNALLTWRNGIHYEGAAAGLETLARRFDRDDVVLIDGRAEFAAALQLGLRYLHGLEALAPCLDTLADGELRAFWRRQQARGRNLQIVTSDAAARMRVERLFAVECAPLTLAYRHEQRGRSQAHRAEWSACRVLTPQPERTAPAATRPARGASRHLGPPS